MSWELHTLDELGDLSRGRSRHRPRDAEHLYGGPYPFVQTGDVKNARLYLTGYSQTYSEAGLAQSKLWPSGTLCITIAANIADTAILGIDACFPDSVIGFTADETKSDTRFVKYLFDAHLKKRLVQFSQGATQDNLSQEKLLSLKFPVPRLDTQRRIADILSPYDDLVENNRKRITLLEGAARLLYREWFVRFRFPGHEHVKITDGMPEGWERVSFSALADYINGFPFKPSDLHDTGLPIIKIPELRDGVIDKTPRNAGNDVPERNMVSDNDLLFSWSGTLLVNFWHHGPAILNQHLFRVDPIDGVSRVFLYFALNEAMTSFTNQTTGSTMKHIRKSALDTVKTLVAPKELMMAFQRHAEAMFDLIHALQKQNQKLTQARDLLLPRIIDGRIAV